MRQEGATYAEEWLRQGKPANTATFSETIPRYLAGGDVAIAATGVALSAGVPMQIGDTASNLTFVTGGTAAGTPTAGVVALYSPAGALVASSADLSTTARAANTAYTVAFSSSYLITDGGLYYAMISITATTVPTLRGLGLGTASILGGAIGLSAPILVQSHGTGVGGTAPATIATPTTTINIPYLAVT